MADFERLGICPEIIRAIEEEEWLLPTPVQDEAIPLILGGGDVCAAAETGSGKTGAFGIPCLQIVHETLQNRATTSLAQAPSAVRRVEPFVFDVDAKDPLVFVEGGGVVARGQADRWLGIRTTGDVTKGKYMFEVTILGGLVRVGWASITSPLEIGRDERSFGYGGTGKAVWNGSFTDYGEMFGNDDVIGCCIDRERNAISFAKNGVFLGQAFTLAPAMQNVPLKPAVCGKRFSVQINTTTALQFPIEGFSSIGCIEPGHTSAGMARQIETGGKGQRKPLCLILEPTRDLAQQTYACMVHFGKYLRAPTIRVGLFVAGVNERAQREALQQGVDIVVGTLQRVAAYARRQELDLSSVRFFVLDEADDLMKNDDNKDIPQLKMRAGIASPCRVQTLFFSATLHSPEVRDAIQRITQFPTWVDLKGKPSIPDTVHFVCYKVDPASANPAFSISPSAGVPPTDGVHQRDPSGPELLSQRVKLLKPRVAVAIADAFDMRSCLIFCRTNLDCDNFERYLTALGGGQMFRGKAETGKENPYSCVVLAGMRSQDERSRNLEYFKSGDVRFLVCTDVAARGLDIQDLPFLMMLSLPEEPDQFFHRVGRVGRADKMGLAISIVSPVKEKVWYHRCPNRGKGCSNTNLIDRGGCCIWYDEPSYLTAIEERVGTKIPLMDPKDFSVAGIIDPPRKETAPKKREEGAVNNSLGRRSHHKAAKQTGDTPEQPLGKMLLYGKAKEGTAEKATLQRLREVAPCVEELREIEKKVQQNYVALLSGGLSGLDVAPRF